MTAQLDKIIKGDKKIIIVTILLLLISSLAAGTESSVRALGAHEFSFIFLIKQLFFSAIALIIMILVSNIPYPIYAKLAKPFYYISLFLVVLTAFIGTSINSAKRWLTVPLVGVTIQTSDFVRIGLIFMVAYLISRKNPDAKLKDKLMDKVVLWSLPIILLIAYNDLSTALITFSVVLLMVFFTGIDYKLYLKKIGIYAGAAVVLVMLAILLNVKRGSTWMSRLSGKENVEYSQKTQGKIAVATANFIPAPGKSQQKYVLANSYTDYIFDILVEEYGIIGAVVIIVLYLVLFYRIYLIIKRQRRTFPLYLALGLALNIILQTFTHIFVNIGIGPVTGQPLPLISMGGSSTLSVAIQIGIILRISYVSEKNKDDYVKPQQEEPEVEDEKIDINDYPILIG